MTAIDTCRNNIKTRVYVDSIKHTKYNQTFFIIQITKYYFDVCWLYDHFNTPISFYILMNSLGIGTYNMCLINFFFL